jgi:GNAT superfamily N-acetyltransferase
MSARSVKGFVQRWHHFGARCAARLPPAKCAGSPLFQHPVYGSVGTRCHSLVGVSRQSQRPDSEQGQVSWPAEQRPGSGRWKQWQSEQRDGPVRHAGRPLQIRPAGASILGAVKVSGRAGAPVSIRAATADQAEQLRGIARAAKGFWGYAPRRVRDWADSLDFVAIFQYQEVYVAEAHARSGRAAIAWVGLLPPVDGVARLDHLWVEPAWMRCSIGSRLFEHARDRAATLGAHVMEWGAEPNAVGFYRRMGGRDVREDVSEWGRRILVMGVDLEANHVSPRKRG